MGSPVEVISMWSLTGTLNEISLRLYHGGGLKDVVLCRGSLGRPPVGSPGGGPWKVSFGARPMEQGP
jgi:hypothetical protein